MPKVAKLHEVGHSARDMYDLVADVEKYPEFLPLCRSLNVRSKKQREGRVMVIADMTVAYKFIQESFTSQVILDPEKLAIDVKYLDGPFRYLHNHWRFSELDEHRCEVSFDLDYELRSRSLQMVMGSVFDLAFSKFTTAFEKRADDIYGKRTS